MKKKRKLKRKLERLKSEARWADNYFRLWQREQRECDALRKRLAEHEATYTAAR